MNVWSVAALGVGSMVGAGIFALLGQAALIAGAQTYLAFCIGGAIALLSGYSFAKLAVRYPEAGGITEYFDAGFGVGPLSGTLSLIYLVTLIGSVAMVGKAFGAYAAPLCFGTSDPLVVDALASTAVVGFFLLNLGRSKLVGRVEILLVAFKLVVLAMLVGAGAIFAGRGETGHIDPTPAALIASAGLTFFAYAGYGVMTNAAASVARPARTIPAAIYIGIGVVIALYVAVAYVVLRGIAPVELAAHPDTAVAQAARPLMGRAGYVVVSLAALAATASSINASLFSAMRVARALGEDGHLPPSFARTLWRAASPGDLWGIGFILVMTDFLDLNAIADVSGAVYLIVYISVHIANWRLAAETGASRAIVALGIGSMVTVLAAFLGNVAAAQPWLLVLVVLLLGGSALVETFATRRALAVASYKNEPGRRSRGGSGDPAG